MNYENNSYSGCSNSNRINDLERELQTTEVLQSQRGQLTDEERRANAQRRQENLKSAKENLRQNRYKFVPYFRSF